MPFLTLAAKDLRLLLRDPRSAVILLLMPLVLILILGVTLGEAFGRKPDDQLQVTIVDEDRGLTDSFGFCEWLVREHRVGLAPGAAFGAGGEGHVRLCFAVEEEILVEALDRFAANWQNGLGSAAGV